MIAKNPFIYEKCLENRINLISRHGVLTCLVFCFHISYWIGCQLAPWLTWCFAIDCCQATLAHDFPWRPRRPSLIAVWLASWCLAVWCLVGLSGPSLNNQFLVCLNEQPLPVDLAHFLTPSAWKWFDSIGPLMFSEVAWSCTGLIRMILFPKGSQEISGSWYDLAAFYSNVLWRNTYIVTTKFRQVSRWCTMEINRVPSKTTA